VLGARAHARDAQELEQLALDARVVLGEIAIEIGRDGAHRSAKETRIGGTSLKLTRDPSRRIVLAGGRAPHHSG
jgi:hypothetical protein